MDRSKRLAKVARNTLIQLMRLFLGGVFTLISTRFALAALGKTDYGIYTVCIGTGAFFGFLTGAITIVTQRTLSMAIHDENGIGNAFKCCLKNHLLVALFFMIAGLAVALPFVVYGLEIPSDRLPSALIVVLGAVTAGVFGIMGAAFEAYLWAREEFAAFGIFNVLGNGLVAAGSGLLHYYSGDRLIAYGLVSCGSNMLITMLSALYVMKTHKAYLHIHLSDIIRARPERIDTSLFIWNITGSLSTILTQQGVMFIVYSFYGAPAAAAMGIANQVANMLRQFGQALNGSLAPRLYVLEARGERSSMIDNALMGSKYIFILVSIVAMVYDANGEFLLATWLGSPPNFTRELSRILVIGLLVELLASQTFTVWQAIGYIQKLYLYSISISMAAITIFYLAARAGLSLSSISLGIVAAAFVNTLIRTAFLKQYRHHILSNWVSLTVLPSLLFCIPVIIWLEISSIVFDGWWKLLIGGFGAFIIALPSAYFFGLEKVERPQLGSILKLVRLSSLGSLEAMMLKFTRRFISSLGGAAYADFQSGRDPSMLRWRLALRDLVSSPIEALKRVIRPISDADLLKRWAEPANLLDDWDERTRAMAAMIPNGAAVLEFGAGRMILRDFLGPDCTYQASDLVARDASTIVCDLNQALPKLRLKYSHAVFSGVFEYIRDIGRVILFLSQEVEYVVASYTPLENLKSLAIRYNNGWVNHLTLEEFIQLFLEGGFVLEKSIGWRDQVILVFRNGGRSGSDRRASSAAEVGS